MILFEEFFDIDRCSTFHPKGLTNGENPRPYHFALLYPTADEIGVLEHGSDVKDGSESPSCEHLLKL